MKRPLECLSRMRYPGRALAVGRDSSAMFNIVIYAITGRSASSQARRLEFEGDTIWTKPTDPEVLQKGNMDLLIYPAVALSEGLAVSNGKQTSDIDVRSGQSPVRVLEEAVQSWSYEPDAPIFTPRISGCVLPSNRAGLSILKRAGSGDPFRFFYEIPLNPGKGKLLTTYSGENRDPLQSFTGDPLDLDLVEPTARAMAEAVYAALEPPAGGEDFRVAAACVFAKTADMKDHRVFIINRRERT